MQVSQERGAAAPSPFPARRCRPLAAPLTAQLDETRCSALTLQPTRRLCRRRVPRGLDAWCGAPPLRIGRRRAGVWPRLLPASASLAALVLDEPTGSFCCFRLPGVRRARLAMRACFPPASYGSAPLPLLCASASPGRVGLAAPGPPRSGFGVLAALVVAPLPARVPARPGFFVCSPSCRRLRTPPLLRGRPLSGPAGARRRLPVWRHPAPLAQQSGGWGGPWASPLSLRGLRCRLPLRLPPSAAAFAAPRARSAALARVGWWRCALLHGLRPRL